MEIQYEALEGHFVRLEPLRPELKEELRAAVDCDEETWLIMPSSGMGARFEGFWSAMLDAPRLERLAYAIRRLSDGRVVGTSSYLGMAAGQRSVEIGGTFLHPDARGGAANPESKMLMLAHAFAAGAVRVQFRVDLRNRRSQAAVTKLGAVREGVLRRDRTTWTGHIRDTVVFSILDSEWPEVRQRIEGRLAQPAPT